MSAAASYDQAVWRSKLNSPDRSAWTVTKDEEASDPLYSFSDALTLALQGLELPDEDSLDRQTVIINCWVVAKSQLRRINVQHTILVDRTGLHVRRYHGDDMWHGEVQPRSSRSYPRKVVERYKGDLPRLVADIQSEYWPQPEVHPLGGAGTGA